MADGEEPAARRTDEIAHGWGLLGMVAGALAGVAVGIAVVGATAATGGAAAVIIAGAVAGGGLAGGQLVSGLTTIFNLPEPTSGFITVGSPNVFINDLAAARASIDFAAPCSGLPLNHPTLWAPDLIAEGSATVRTNDVPQSRLKMKMVCGAHIKTSSPNVIIGGPTERTNFVFDLEGWFKTGLEVLGLAALIGGGLLAAAAGAAAFAGFVLFTGGTMLAFEGLGRLGDMIGPGYRDLFQGIAGFGLLAASPRMARNARTRMVAAEEAAAHRARVNALAADEAASAAKARPGTYGAVDGPTQVARNRAAMANRTDAERAVIARDKAEITRLSNESAAARARAEVARTSQERAAENALADRRLAEAREILRPHVERRDSAAIVERLDVSSPRDRGFLWSGDKAEAGRLARAAGGTTLEQTPGGRVIDDWPLLNKRYLPWEEGGEAVWGGASERYAQGLSGQVRNVQTTQRYVEKGGYTFQTYERPQVRGGQTSGRITGVERIKLPGTFTPRAPRTPPTPPTTPTAPTSP
ncbi:MAG: PAAR domain-containing protein [Polyangiales bacterium]